MVPLAATREQISILKSAGLRIAWREFVKPHSIAGELELGVVRDFIRAGFKPA
jgi:hypothetical protein